jgi:hypothetical protein
MKSSLIRIGGSCLLVILLLAGCQSAKKAFIPLTGDNATSARVESARDDTIHYLVSTSRLEVAPPETDWRLDTTPQRNGEYRFLSGDWVMSVWSTGRQAGDQRVILRDKQTDTVWCGYIQPDGSVVDTSYLP